MAIIAHNDIRPDGLRIFYGNAPPGSSSDGTYYTGEIIVNIGSSASSPFAAAPTAWKCISGGTPGNWAATGVSSNPEVYGPFNGATASFSFPCDANYIITGVDVCYTSGVTNGSIQIERDIGSTPVGSGVVQMTTPISLASTANVVYAGVMIGSPSMFIGGVDRLGIVTAGTLTNLGGLMINIQLVRTI